MIRFTKKPRGTASWSVYPYTERMKELLTTTSRFGDSIELFKINKDRTRLFVPRGICPTGYIDNRVDGLKVKFHNNIMPRNDEQRELMNETVGLLKQGENFQVQAPTGSGKTVIALDAVAHIGRKTIIVVTKSDLMEQWYKEAIKHLGLLPKEIGIVRQYKCQTVGKKLIIGMIQSLCKDKYPTSSFSDIGLVVWDECHRANADTFRKTLDMFPAKLRLGLSATPKRKDGKEIIFTSHIGPIKVIGESIPMEPKVIVVPSKWKFPRQIKKGKLVRIPHNPGKSAHITRILSRNIYRNTLIVKYIKAAYKKDRTIVVFSNLGVENHLGRLRQMLVKEGVPAKDISYYVGMLNGKAMKKKELDKASVKRIILTTYGMMGEGTDFPWLDCAVFATPRSDVTQPAGRILREYPDKKKPIIIDFVDIDSPVYKKFYYKRKVYYKSVNAVIIEK